MSKHKWQSVEQAQKEFWDEMECGKSHFELENPHLIETYYVHGTTALYDAENDVYYNKSGSRLRDLKEYDTSYEGYTPFGDEGY